MTKFEEQYRSSNKAALLKTMLRNEGSIPQQTAQEILGTEVSSVLCELRRDGCVFEEDGSGLRFARMSDLLKPEYVFPYMKIDVPVLWKEETGTTNDDAKEAAAAGLSRAVCFAEHQLAGKGRLGRQWHSGDEEAVEVSIMLHTNAPAQAAAGIGLAAGLAVSDALAQETGVRTELKWPNDVLAGGRKICGILVEAAVDGNALRYVVIGIGVNLNQTQFPDALADIATSVAMETGKRTSRPRFAATLVERVIGRTEQYLEGGFEAIREEYEARSSVLHKVVNVSMPDGSVQSGRCTGFGPTGEITVLVDGKERTFYASDVSVREADHV